VSWLELPALAHGQNHSTNVKAVREEFCSYLNLEGAVCWQWMAARIDGKEFTPFSVSENLFLFLFCPKKVLYISVSKYFAFTMKKYSLSQMIPSCSLLMK